MPNIEQDIFKLRDAVISTLTELAGKPLSSAENIKALTELLALIYKIQKELPVNVNFDYEVLKK